MDSENTGQALPPGTCLEEFVIERVLGSGGFGITYLARDTELGRRVVIKENLPVQFCFRDTHSLTVAPRHSHGDDAANFQWSLDSFSREAATLASLDHPGIVKVLRSFRAFGTAYFVMPFVEGITLDDLIKQRMEKGRGFSEEELLGLLTRVLDALSHLHARGIYHRDIKPGNILITTDGVPALIDFGAARQMVSERSMTVIESPGYTPFEQLQSRGNIGPWSDIYSLAGTLYKMLTFEAPPKAMDRVRHDPVGNLAADPSLSGYYSQQFLVALDYAFRFDESERWQSAGDWIEALNKTTVAAAEENPGPPVEFRHQQRPLQSKPPPPPTPPGMPPEVPAVGEIASNSPRKLAQGMIGVLAGCVVLVAMVVWAITNVHTGAKAARAAAQEERAKAAAESERRQLEERDRMARQEEERKAREAETARLAVEKAAEQERLKAAEAARRAEEPKPGDRMEIEIASGVKMAFRWCPAGTFLMGSPESEAQRQTDETQYRVTLSKGFWLAETEVTQGQWKAVMGNNPSHFKGSDPLPVETVSWEDAQGFFTKAKAPAGMELRLPTEAEWEYACRAGTTTVFGHGDRLNGKEANMDGNYPYPEGTPKGPYLNKTVEVGSYAANQWGLRDMHGNVWEWCAGWYGPYPTGAVTDPRGPADGSNRVNRGGGWGSGGWSCRSAYRNWLTPGNRRNVLGFRVAAVPSP